MSTSPKKASDILERMRSVAVRERGEDQAEAPTEPEAPAPSTDPPAARVPRARAPRPAPAVPAPPAPSRPAGEKPVRYTLDLSREQHRFLKQFALDAEVDASEVMRTLLKQLQLDAALAAKVQSKLG